MSTLTAVFSDIAVAIRGKNGLTTTYKPTEMAQAITDIPSGGGDKIKAIAGGMNGLCFISYDGINFIVSASCMTQIKGVAYINFTPMNETEPLDEFLLVGTKLAPTGGGLNSNVVRIKSDGTREAVSVGSSSTTLSRVRRLSFDGNNQRLPCVAILDSNSNNIVCYDGTTWWTTSTSVRIYDVAFSPNLNKYVAVGASGTILTSSDFSHWSTWTSSAGAQILSVVWCRTGQCFVAIDNSGNCYTSTNGTTWNTSALPSGSGLGGAEIIYCWELDLLLIVDYGGIYVSSNGGTSWTYHKINTVAGNEALRSITCVDNHIVAVGNALHFVRSDDGTTWKDSRCYTTYQYSNMTAVGGTL